MNKFVNIAILVLLAVFISFRINVACNELAKPGETSPIEAMDLDLPVIFQGTIPCMECPDATVTLHLEGTSYLLQHKTEGTPETTLEERGSWELRADTLFTFDTASNLATTYLLTDQDLIPLDRPANATYPRRLEKVTPD